MVPKVIDLFFVWLLVVHHHIMSTFLFAINIGLSTVIDLPGVPGAAAERDIYLVHLDKVLAFVDDPRQRLLALRFDSLLEFLDHFAILLLTVDVIALLRIHGVLQLLLQAQLLTIELVVLLVELGPVLGNKLHS